MKSKLSVIKIFGIFCLLNTLSSYAQECSECYGNGVVQPDISGTVYSDPAKGLEIHYEPESAYGDGDYAFRTYINGKMSGPVVAFYNSGKLKAEGYVLDGKPHGPFQNYLENGLKFADYIYKNGVIAEGISTQYYENNKVFLVFHIKDDHAVGKVQMYYPDGSLQIDANVQYNQNIKNEAFTGTTSGWVNASIEGLVKTYYQNGRKDLFVSPQNASEKVVEGIGVPFLAQWLCSKFSDDVFLPYYQNGILTHPRFYNEAEYSDNLRHGSYKSFYENSKLLLEATYEKGNLVGDLKVYDIDGQLITKEHYINGKKDGISVIFDKNKQIKELIVYALGKKKSIIIQNGVNNLFDPVLWQQHMSKETILLLSEQFPDLLAQTDDHGKTVLMYAIQSNNPNIVEAILPLSNVNAQDHIGKTALIYISQKSFNYSIAKLLLDAGADITIKDNTDKTAFDYAKSNLSHRKTPFFKLLQTAFKFQKNS